MLRHNAEIVIIPSDLERRSKFCLKVKGISAKKKNNNIITVLESTQSRIPIGSVIYSEALLFPNCNIINQCLEANFSYASLKIKSKELIVTHSTKSGIPIGTVVVKIKSLLVDPLAMNLFFKKPIPSEDAINYDAKQSAKRYMCSTVWTYSFKITHYMQFQKN